METSLLALALENFSTSVSTNSFFPPFFYRDSTSRKHKDTLTSDANNFVSLYPSPSFFHQLSPSSSSSSSSLLSTRNSNISNTNSKKGKSNASSTIEDEVIQEVHRRLKLSSSSSSTKRPSIISKPLCFVTSGSKLSRVPEAFALLRSGVFSDHEASRLLENIDQLPLSRILAVADVETVAESVKNEAKQWLALLREEMKNFSSPSNNHQHQHHRSSTTTNSSSNRNNNNNNNNNNNPFREDIVRRLNEQELKASQILDFASDIVEEEDAEDKNSDNNDDSDEDFQKIVTNVNGNSFHKLFKRFQQQLTNFESVISEGTLDPNLVASWLTEPNTITALFHSSFLDLTSMSSLRSFVPVAASFSSSSSSSSSSFSSSSSSAGSEMKSRLRVLTIPVICAPAILLEKPRSWGPLVVPRSTTTSNSITSSSSASNSPTSSSSPDLEFSSKQLEEMRYKISTILYRSLVIAGFKQHSEQNLFLLSSMFSEPIQSNPTLNIHIGLVDLALLDELEVEALIDVLREVETNRQGEIFGNQQRGGGGEEKNTFLKSIVLCASNSHQQKTWNKTIDQHFSSSSSSIKPLSLFSLHVVGPSSSYSSSSSYSINSSSSSSYPSYSLLAHLIKCSFILTQQQHSGSSSSSSSSEESSMVSVVAPFVVIAAAPSSCIMLSSWSANVSSLKQCLHVGSTSSQNITNSNSNSTNNKKHQTLQQRRAAASQQKQQQQIQHHDFLLLRQILDFAVDDDASEDSENPTTFHEPFKSSQIRTCDPFLPS